MPILGSEGINTEYICVLRKRGDHFFYEKEGTCAPLEVIDRLYQMIQDPNSTVLDMQSFLDRLIPGSPRESFNYLSPQEYDEPFTIMAFYPRYYTSQGYQNLLNNEECQFKASFLEENKFLLETDPKAYYERFFNQREHVLCEFRDRIKNEYLEEASKYIFAWYYYNTVKKLGNDDSVVMVSFDCQGKKTVEFVINDDFSVSVSTNFGFGKASFFILCLKYKGILILPYSHLVKYDYAEKRDLVRYTRKYKPSHNSWDELFRFIEDAANLLIDNRDAFIHKYIIDEIDKMVNGLDSLINDPFHNIETSSAFADSLRPSSFLTVKNIRQGDSYQYGLSPREMLLATIVEKLIGALDYLDNLTQLSEFLPIITPQIEKIKELAGYLVIDIREALNSLLADINGLKEKVEKDSQDLSSVEVMLELYSDVLEDEFKENSNQTDRETIELNFNKANPAYRDLKVERFSLQESIQKTKDNLELFENFKKSLEEGLEIILTAS